MIMVHSSPPVFPISVGQLFVFVRADSWPKFFFLKSIIAKAQLRYAISYRVDLFRANAFVLQFERVLITFGRSNLQHIRGFPFDNFDISQIPPMQVLGASVWFKCDGLFQDFQLAVDVAPHAPFQSGPIRLGADGQARCPWRQRYSAQPRRDRIAISGDQAEREMPLLYRTISDQTSGIDREDAFLLVP